MGNPRQVNTKVVVKVNAPELVRRKMASPGWQGEHIAMGTNVDCYQRAEGRYQLMPTRCSSRYNLTGRMNAIHRIP